MSHYEVVEVLEEALSFRYLTVVKDEYAVSADGMKMFGVMDLNTGFDGGSFSIGLRNSNDKSMRLALTAGYRVFVCDNMAFSGDFTPLLHKHTRNLDLRDSISIAVDRIQRGFNSMEMQVKAMQEFGLTDNDARIFIYAVFLEQAIKGAPRNLMPVVHDYYFKPSHDAFASRNLWSLSNAFTSAFKKLAPMKQFEVTAKLGTFVKQVQVCWKKKPYEVSDLGTDPFQGHGRDKDEYEGYEEYLDNLAKSEPIRKISGAQNESTGSDNATDDDLAEVVANIDDYFDQETERDDEMKEEYKRQVVA